MYMQDDAHVMGHLFVTFVAALLRFELARLIDEADLASSYSPEDVLDVYATMKVVTGDAEIRQVVPKDVRDLDAKLGVFLYSTQEDRDKLDGSVTVKGEVYGIPNDIVEGQTLPDYKMSVKVTFLKTTVRGFDRKVVSRESITVPAGTFDCFVIEETQDVRNLFMKEHVRSRTWYARGIGAVKVQEYDSDGYLITEQELVEKDIK